MIRRWLIRVPCLLALAFVVGVWVTSYFAVGGISKQGGDHAWIVLVGQGFGAIGDDFSGHFPDMPFKFGAEWGNPDLGTPPTKLGFYVGIEPGLPDSFLIVVPFWFPTLLLTGLSWFVWRKTREKPETNRGFPVEPASSTPAPPPPAH